MTAFSVPGHGVYPKSVSGDGPRRTPVTPLWVSVSLGSTLLVIGAVVAAVGLANLFVAARRPLAWAAAASVAAWLLSGVVDILGRWVPRGLAVLMTVLGLVLVAGGGWVGVRATLAAEVDQLRTALPAAASDLETRFGAAADFNLVERTTTFVEDLDDRVAALSERGIEPAERETYENGVTKVIYEDAEGNEISYGGVTS